MWGEIIELIYLGWVLMGLSGSVGILAFSGFGFCGMGFFGLFGGGVGVL